MSYIDDLIEGKLRTLSRDLEYVNDNIEWHKDALSEAQEKKARIECMVAELALEQRKRKEENEKVETD